MTIDFHESKIKSRSFPLQKSCSISDLQRATLKSIRINSAGNESNSWERKKRSTRRRRRSKKTPRAEDKGLIKTYSSVESFFAVLRSFGAGWTGQWAEPGREEFIIEKKCVQCKAGPGRILIEICWAKFNSSDAPQNDDGAAVQIKKLFALKTEQKDCIHGRPGEVSLSKWAAKTTLKLFAAHKNPQDPPHRTPPHS